jgi:hypothetical protein
MGLSPDHGHLYQTERREAHSTSAEEALVADLRAQEYAEYAAHSERLGLAGSAIRYSSADRRDSLPATGPDIETPTRTLLVVEDIRGLRATAAREVLYDFGAVAVKDPTGHWRFSPYGKVCRSQE